MVLHGTAGRFPHDLRWLCDPQKKVPAERRSRVSAHYYIARSGDLYALVSEGEKAWHAGKSEWKGREGCNDFSIGIELEHPGPTRPIPYTDAQYEVLGWLLADILARHHLTLEDVVGHDQVSPGRKSDPWSFFDWEKARASARKYQKEPAAPHVVEAYREPPKIISKRMEAHVAEKHWTDTLREELTEEKSDEVIAHLKGVAKLALPDLPVEIGAKLLDLLVPGLLCDALEKVFKRAAG